MSSILATDQLREFILAKYAVIKPSAQFQGIVGGLRVHFGNGTPQNAEESCAYADHEAYHYVCTEKGRVISHRSTTDLFEVSYWILQNRIANIALKCRAQPNQDFRRAFFAEELRLLALVGPEYRKRREQEIQDILRSHPYKDDL